MKFAAELAKACPEEHAIEYQRWRERNRIEDLETVVAALLAKNKELQANTSKVDKATEQKARAAGAGSCALLKQLITSTEYQPAVVHKDMVDKLLSATTLTSAAKEKTEKVQKQSPPLDSDVIKKDLAQIELVMFDYGVSHSMGMVSHQTHPVLLFENGEACKDMGALVFPGGLTAHKAEHPSRWTQWRKSWGDYELLRGENWKKLHFNQKYPPIEKGFRLNNTFHHLGSFSTGDSMTSLIKNYQFFSDGRFVSGAQAYASAETANSSTAFTHVSPDQKGRYEIEGYLLTLHYENGETQYKAIVLDMDDPSPIWLNGAGFVE
ncbi:hypothetical protein [Hahella chejuensis]|nr:hypothetical protein [Hahella chejuensis]